MSKLTITLSCALLLNAATSPSAFAILKKKPLPVARPNTCIRQLEPAEQSSTLTLSRAQITPAAVAQHLNREVNVTLTTGVQISGTIAGGDQVNGAYVLNLTIGRNQNKSRGIALSNIEQITLNTSTTDNVDAARLAQIMSTQESLPANDADRNMLNAQLYLRNHMYIQSQVIPALGARKAFEAINVLYTATLKDTYFKISSSSGATASPEQEIEYHRFYRAHPLRIENKANLIVNKIPALSGGDLEIIFRAYAAKLDQLCFAAAEKLAKTRRSHILMGDFRETYATAVWARRMLVALSPGVEANSRVGKELFSWVIERIAFLSDKNPLQPDLFSSKYKELVTSYNIGEQKTRLLYPYNDDSDFGLTSSMNHWYTTELHVYSSFTERPWLYIAWNNQDKDAAPRTATVIGPSLFNITQARTNFINQEGTVRDFYIEYLDRITLGSVLTDRAVQAETELLLDVMRRRN